MKQQPTYRNSESRYLSTKDFMITGESFDLIWDDKYEMLVTQPQPNPEAIAKYYQSEAYVSHNDSSKGLVNFLYQKVKGFNLYQKQKWISNFKGPNGSLLDVGAGTGDFLAYAKSKGWSVQGIEPNEQARKLASEKGVILKSNLSDLKGERFDVITLWHVLEHLHNLEEQIQILHSMLKKDGVLIVAVPNFRSLDAKIYGPFWAAYDTPRHLWHFSRKSIEKLFAGKFTLAKVTPMLFDAFYVSLLSEKYRSGSSFSLRAIWNGLRSNLSAMRTKEYSSLVYCLKKVN